MPQPATPQPPPQDALSSLTCESDSESDSSSESDDHCLDSEVEAIMNDVFGDYSLSDDEDNMDQ